MLRGFSWKHGIRSFPPRRAVVVASRLSHADLPTRHAYSLKPGQPAPGLHNLLRPLIASLRGTGILTCFPSATPFGLALGADSPCADERGAGNLGLTATRLFTLFNATHVSIRTSDTSSRVYTTTFTGLQNALLPLAINCKSAASVTGLAPLHLPRRTTRSVSYYAFFK